MKQEQNKWRLAVITLSDKGYRGEREDRSGPLICELFTTKQYELQEYKVLPDEPEMLERELIRLSDEEHMDLILTTGGTGFAVRDCTPEVTLSVATRHVPGIADAMRYYSLQITPNAMLGRGVSVIRNQTLIINLPGSPKAVKESLSFIQTPLEHGLRILKGLDGDCGSEV